MTAGSHYWRAVSQATSIPQRTLNDWAMQPWFATLVAELRAEKGAELDAAFTAVLEGAVQQLKDRVEHGDVVLVGGELKRRPVSGRDLAVICGVIYDKRQLARAQAPADGTEMTGAEIMATLAAYAHAERSSDDKPLAVEYRRDA